MESQNGAGVVGNQRRKQHRWPAEAFGGELELLGCWGEVEEPGGWALCHALRTELSSGCTGFAASRRQRGEDPASWYGETMQRTDKGGALDFRC